MDAGARVVGGGVESRADRAVSGLAARPVGAIAVSGRGRGWSVCWRCLRGLGVLAAERPALGRSPIDLLLSSFERYLVSERGLAAGTVVGYLRHARWFVEGLAVGRAGRVSAADVTGAVLRKAGSGVSVSAAQILRVGAASVSAFLLSRGAARGGSLAGGAGGPGPARVAVAARDQPRGRASAAWLLRSSPARWGGVITR